jgi:hypothetical protein
MVRPSDIGNDGSRRAVRTAAAISRQFAIAVAFFTLGCEPAPSSRPNLNPGEGNIEEIPEITLPDKVVVIDAPSDAAAQTESRSFTHEFTGVSLHYPVNWIVQEPRIDGWLARIDLSQDGGFRSPTGVDVSVYFGRTSAADDTESAMLAKEFMEMREVHGTGLQMPERVRVGQREGYRLRIDPPLPGISDSKLHRDVYYFFVDSVDDLPNHATLARGKWTVSIWVDAQAENLDRASEVLYGFRWKD